MQYNAMCNVQCNAMQRNATQCNAMQCNAMQRNATQRNAMQCNAMQCNTIQFLSVERNGGNTLKQSDRKLRRTQDYFYFYYFA